VSAPRIDEQVWVFKRLPQKQKSLPEVKGTRRKLELRKRGNLWGSGDLCEASHLGSRSSWDGKRCESAKEPLKCGGNTGPETWQRVEALVNVKRTGGRGRGNSPCRA